MVPKRLIITFLSGTAIVVVSVAAIQFAKGYRPGTQGTVKGTGLLAANSFPNGAQVFLNGELATATDNTLNKDPGEYTVEIKKDGFHTWSKKIRIEKELVVQTNALLLPTAPSLSPLSFNGALNITPSPDGQRIAFTVASASSAIKNGVYTLDLSDTLLSLQKGPKQIIKVSNASEARDLARAEILWAPDNSSILLKIDGKSYLADPDKLQARAELEDTTGKLDALLAEWKEDFFKRRANKLKKFPLDLQQIASASASSFYISPDENLLLYTASASARLPDKLLTQDVKAASTQPQERTLVNGRTYVYDLREDRNFLVGVDPESVASPAPTPKSTKTSRLAPKAVQAVAQPAPQRSLTMIEELNKAYSPAIRGGWQWYPDSRHLLGLEQGSVVIKEYDNQNAVAVYAGPRSTDFVYPWPNGSKIIILANFTPDPTATPNLYAVSLK